MPFGSSTAGRVCPYSSVCLPNMPAVRVTLAAVPTRVSIQLNLSGIVGDVHDGRNAVSSKTQRLLGLNRFMALMFFRELEGVRGVIARFSGLRS
ncbi:hypothetical protein [Phocaeicola sp.]|uniref:hypothetical protein n=1 Tax=Phocaeicola sp. TaxID=2773926 RepID=UPI00307C9DF9